MHAEVFSDAAQLIESGSSDCHGLVLPCDCRPLDRALGGDSDKFSDEACVAEIARLHFPGDGAFLNDENPLRKRGDEVEILLDQDHGQAAVVAQPLQGLDNLVDDRGLDTLGRLVEQDKPRLAAEAARDRQQLLLAARQRAAGTVEKHLEAGKLLQHRLDNILLRAGLCGAPHSQIVVNRKAGENLAPLRHIAEPESRPAIGFGRRHVVIVKAYMSAGRRQKAHQRLEQRGLAHAVMAENSDELALIDGEADPVEDRNAAVAGAQPCHIEHHAAACLPKLMSRTSSAVLCTSSCVMPAAGSSSRMSSGSVDSTMPSSTHCR